MDNDKLRRFLHEYDVVWERYHRLSGEVSDLEGQIASQKDRLRKDRLRSVGWILASCALALGLLLPVSPARFFREEETPPFLAWFAVVLLTACLARTIQSRLCLRGLRREIDSLRGELTVTARRQEKAESHLQRLDAAGILPEPYRNRAGKLRGFLETGRADTLKEAVNLLEQEEAQERLRRDIVDRYDRTMARLEEIAEHLEGHEDTLNILGTGLVQCKQAAEYTAEHLAEAGPPEDESPHVLPFL